MFCSECGEKLTLMLCGAEGLIPYCKNCNKYRFPQFATAVSMVVTNRTKDKVLLAKHKGKDGFVLIAGYIKKGETAEKAVVREFKEETKLDTVKFRYNSSKYFEPNNVLMLNFISMAEDGEIVPDTRELEEVKWFSPDEALEIIDKETTAYSFLKNALPELKKL